MLRKIYLKRLVSVLMLALLFPLTACDEDAVRQLGAKVGSRGQDVGNSAAKVISELAAYEDVDYRQRMRVAILNRNSNNLATLPHVEHNRIDQDQIANRIRLYKQFARAYAALQTLSQTEFADQATEAATELNNSITAIKSAPKLPAGVGSALSRLTGIIVDRKQAKSIRKHSYVLAQLVAAHRALWALDRPVWDRYLNRIRDAYIRPLSNIPADRFDAQQLRKIIDQPFSAPYLAHIYKTNEAARVQAEISEFQDRLDVVDDAFTQLEKAHKELTEQKPSYSDVIASLDRIVTILQDLKPTA